MRIQKSLCLALSLAIGLGAAASGCNDDHKDASAKLISAFQSACVTSGQWTSQALAHNQSIISVLTDLKNNDACKPFASTLATVQSLSGQIQGLLTNKSYSDYRLAEEKLQDLTLALQSATPGSALATALGTEIVTTQVDLAEKRAANTVSNEVSDRDRYANATLQLASYMQGVLQQTDGLTACLQQSPSAAIELATNLLAIGGSFVSPILGAGVAVVGQLINIGVEYARTSGTNSAIWDLYGAQMPLALSCGMEAMTELYCDANDAFSLLDLQAQSYPQPGADPQPIWRGLDILGRRLPVLNDWLLGVKNGVLPNDPLEAERQNEIWRKLLKLDEYYRDIYAGFNYAKQLYDAATGNPQIQQSLLIQGIKSTSETLAGSSSCGSGMGGGMSSGGSSSNPFTEKSSNSDTYACWLVLGVDSTNCPQPVDSMDCGEKYIRNHLLAQATMSGLFDNWKGIYSEVKAQVDLEFAQTVTADPESLLASAREAAPDNVAPRTVLVMIRDFLQGMLDGDDGSNPQLPALLSDTLKLVKDTLATLDDSSAQPLENVRKIFDTLQLAHGLQFFDERIGRFIQWDIQDRLRKGEFPHDVAELLREAGGDIRDRLMASGVHNLVLVSQDLNQARALAQRNIEIFRDYFTPSFANSVKTLDKAARDAGEPATGADRPNGQLLAQVCTLLLATGNDWPGSVPWDICSRATLNSIYPDPDGSMTIQLGKLRDQLAGTPYQTRMCAFHRFLQAGRMAEILRESGTPADLVDHHPRPMLDTRGVLELWDPEAVLRFVTGAARG